MFQRRAAPCFYPSISFRTLRAYAIAAHECGSLGGKTQLQARRRGVEEIDVAAAGVAVLVQDLDLAFMDLLARRLRRIERAHEKETDGKQDRRQARDKP